jgi:ArsR family transcriptional regulator
MVTSRTAELSPGDECEVDFAHPEQVAEAQSRIPDDASVMALAETFGTLGDPTRIRMIAALTGGELCVCDLAQVLGLTRSAVSHQLRLLRGQGLVRFRKEGKMAFYTLDDDHIKRLMAEGISHVEEG